MFVKLGRITLLYSKYLIQEESPYLSHSAREYIKMIDNKEALA